MLRTPSLFDPGFLSSGELIVKQANRAGVVGGRGNHKR
jgi:hypothetical protein